MEEDVKKEEEKIVIGRLVYIMVSAEIYLLSLKNAQFLHTVMNPLPQDAKFMRGGNDALGRMYLVIESQEFDEVLEGDEIPFYGPIVFSRPNFGEAN